MAILYYDNTGLVRASASGDGLPLGMVDASFKKFAFDESKNPGLLEFIAPRLNSLKDVAIVGDTDVQVASKSVAIIGKDVSEAEAEAFYRSVATYKSQMKTGITQWASLTTSAEKQAFVLNNFDKLMTILDGILGFEKFLVSVVLKVTRL